MKPKITQEAIKAASAQYLKIVEWSKEDNCFVGRAPGLFFGGCHGSNERKVYAELCDIVEEHVEDLLSSQEFLPAATAGKHYSGKFLVRVSSDLHQKVAVQALAHGISLNQAVADALAYNTEAFDSALIQSRVSESPGLYSSKARAKKKSKP